MKKYFALILVLMMLAATTVPAFAAGKSPAGNGNKVSGNGPFSLTGTIVSLNPDSRTVTVSVACGNKWVKPFMGQTLTLQTNDATRFLLRNPGITATLITYSNLAAGQKVSINGQLANNVWIAQKITVGADLLCQP